MTISFFLEDGIGGRTVQPCEWPFPVLPRDGDDIILNVRGLALSGIVRRAAWFQNETDEWECRVYVQEYGHA